MKNSEVQALIEKGNAISQIFLQNLLMARSSWSHWQTLNENSGELVTAAENLGCSIAGIKASFIRDTILALSRMSDPPKSDRATLCCISQLLQDGALREHLIAQDSSCVPYIELIISKVPRVVTKDMQPIYALYNWRAKIESIRNQYLAHLKLENSESDGPTLDSVHEGISLITELVRASCVVFTGRIITDRALFEVEGSSNQFWGYAKEGFINEAKTQLTKLDVAMRRIRI